MDDCTNPECPDAGRCNGKCLALWDFQLNQPPQIQRTWFINILNGDLVSLRPNDPRTEDPIYRAADGTEVSRNDFPDLFKVIGTRYGSGADIGTFKLPDLRR